MEQLKVEYLSKEQLKPYAMNAKLHPAEQVEQIKKSIRDFGFDDPIAVWGDNEIVEGHGRLLAVMEMEDIKTVPVIRLDHLSEEQKKAYSLIHNKLTMNSDFDFDILQDELSNIDIDLTDYGFDLRVEDLNVSDSDFISDTEITKSKTKKIQCPYCGKEFDA